MLNGQMENSFNILRKWQIYQITCKTADIYLPFCWVPFKQFLYFLIVYVRDVVKGIYMVIRGQSRQNLEPI